MKCDECDQEAGYHITLAEQRVCTEHKHLCGGHAKDYLAIPRIRAVGTPLHVGAEVLVDVRMLVVCEDAEQHYVYLCEEGGDRIIPFSSGIFEASGIDRRLRQTTWPRPLTHDALASTIRNLGGELRDVIIRTLVDATYYASLRIEQSGRLLDVDVRPSDAIQMAIVCGVPIMMSEDLLPRPAKGGRSRP